MEYIECDKFQFIALFKNEKKPDQICDLYYVLSSIQFKYKF